MNFKTIIALLIINIFNNVIPILLFIYQYFNTFNIINLLFLLYTLLFTIYLLNIFFYVIFTGWITYTGILSIIKQF